ncbi:hypothetical protein BJV82DRAFT_153643 [Fennellomyces sp. T-0311]|nr:hypothetical protein BJV82DRAFT_153643 [Fennellomyces sp. T-0311]
MQLTSFSVLLLASASALASPILIERQEQHQDFTITTPAAQDVVVAGHATTISWTPGDNTPLTISLTESEGGNVINLAIDVNGSTGSYLVNIPAGIANCSEHKIVIQYADNSQSVYSETFFIAADNTTTSCVPEPTASSSSLPDGVMAADKLSGATATASIDILDENGNPVDIPNSESLAIKTSHPAALLSSVAIAGLSAFMMVQ